jgi:hypothetical protein
MYEFFMMMAKMMMVYEVKPISRDPGNFREIYCNYGFSRKLIFPVNGKAYSKAKWVSSRRDQRDQKT